MDSDENNRYISKWKKHFKDWQDLGTLIEKFSKQLHAAEKSLVFTFLEGTLVTAMKKGKT